MDTSAQFPVSSPQRTASSGVPRERRRTLVDVAYDELHEQIVSGELGPERTIRYRDAEALLAMSAIPIREALGRLEREGLVDIVPHHGARVAAVSLDDLGDTYVVRKTLEGLAVRRAANALSTSDVARLEQRLSVYAQAESMQASARELSKAHADFHFALYQTAGSAWLMRLIAPLWANSERYRRLSLGARGGPPNRLQEHRYLLDLCRSHDVDGATTEIEAHLQRTRDLIEQGKGGWTAGSNE